MSILRCRQGQRAQCTRVSALNPGTLGATGRCLSLAPYGIPFWLPDGYLHGATRGLSWVFELDRPMAAPLGDGIDTKGQRVTRYVLMPDAVLEPIEEPPQ